MLNNWKIKQNEIEYIQILVTNQCEPPEALLLWAIYVQKLIDIAEGIEKESKIFSDLKLNSKFEIVPHKD